MKVISCLRACLWDAWFTPPETGEAQLGGTDGLDLHSCSRRQDRGMETAKCDRTKALDHAGEAREGDDQFARQLEQDERQRSKSGPRLRAT